jgi:hypothetical protein
MAQFLDIGVIAVVSGRTQDEKVATIAFLTEPAKGFVEIAAAAHHGDARCGRDREIILVSNAKVLVGSAMSEIYGQQ